MLLLVHPQEMEVGLLSPQVLDAPPGSAQSRPFVTVEVPFDLDDGDGDVAPEGNGAEAVMTDLIR